MICAILSASVKMFLKPCQVYIMEFFPYKKAPSQMFNRVLIPQQPLNIQCTVNLTKSAVTGCAVYQYTLTQPYFVLGKQRVKILYKTCYIKKIRKF